MTELDPGNIGDAQRLTIYKDSVDQKHYTRTSKDKYNSFQSLKTTITTAATKIEIPEDCAEISLMHVSTGVIIWIGNDNTITANGTNVFPLVPNTPLTISLKKGNENNLYGIVASGSEAVYVGGAINE